FFFSSRRRHTRFSRDWSSDVCSSDLYAAMRRRLSDREAQLARERAGARRAEAARSLEHLRPGDVIIVPSGRRSGLAVVLDPGVGRRSDGPAPLVLTADRTVQRLLLPDFPSAAVPGARYSFPH